MNTSELLTPLSSLPPTEISLIGIFLIIFHAFIFTLLLIHVLIRCIIKSRRDPTRVIYHFEPV